MKQKPQRITFDLPAMLKRQLVKAAADNLISVSAYIRQVLAKHLNRNRKGSNQ